MYEPFIEALPDYFKFDLRPIALAEVPIDNWQRSPWQQSAPSIGSLPKAKRNVSKAMNAGLKFRSAEETCSALISWWPEGVALREKVAKEVNDERTVRRLPAAPQPAADGLRAGVSYETEANLLMAFSGHGKVAT